MRIATFLATTLFMLSPAMAGNIAVKLTNGNLNISAKLSFYESKPIVISGFDESNRPYKLSIATTAQAKNVLAITYVLNRNGKIQSGKIVQEKGRLATISSIGDNGAGVTFEAKITN